MLLVVVVVLVVEVVDVDVVLEVVEVVDVVDAVVVGCVVVVVDVVVEVVVVVVVVVVVDVVVVVAGTCLSPKRTSERTLATMLIDCGLDVVTCHPDGTCSVTVYQPVGMQFVVATPPLPVVLLNDVGPVTLNTKPGNVASPCSHTPLALGSSNLKNTSLPCAHK